MPSSDTQFKSGPGNPGAGRPKGARNKITKKYLASLLKAYDPEVIEKVKEKHPEAYLKFYAALVPKDVDVDVSGAISISVVDYQDDD